MSIASINSSNNQYDFFSSLMGISTQNTASTKNTFNNSSLSQVNFNTTNSNVTYSQHSVFESFLAKAQNTIEINNVIKNDSTTNSAVFNRNTNKGINANYLSESGRKEGSGISSEQELELAINYSIRSFYGAELGLGISEEDSQLANQYSEEYKQMQEIWGQRKEEIKEKYDLDSMTKEELYYLDKSPEGQKITEDFYNGFSDNEQMKKLISLFQPELIAKYNI